MKRRRSSFDLSPKSLDQQSLVSFREKELLVTVSYSLFLISWIPYFCFSCHQNCPQWVLVHYGLSCLSNWWPINPRMPNMLPTVYVDISFWSIRYDTHFLSIQFNVCLLRNAFLEPISTLGRIFPDWQSNNVLDIRLKAPFWIQIRDVRSINVLIILASTLTFDVLAIKMLFNPRLYFCLDFVVHFALVLHA